MTNHMPAEGDDFTDEFLVECFSMNLRLTVLLHDEVRPNFNRERKPWWPSGYGLGFTGHISLGCAPLSSLVVTIGV